MLKITNTIIIEEDELEEKFIRSPGAGGQNVNKVSTAVQLRFHAKNCPTITATVFSRLRKIANHLMTLEGEIILTANQTRSQDRNRQEARDRLSELIRQATTVQKHRRPTKPGKNAKAKRTDKKTRGRVSKSEY